MERCPPEIKTIADAKRWLIQTTITLKACKCPVCGQAAKLYPRKLSAALARFLADIYYQTQALPFETRWLNISKDLIVRSDRPIPRDYSILRFWGLLEPASDSPGYWRITETGAAFVEGRMVVPREVYLYNNCSVRLSETTIDFHDAMLSEFRLKSMLEKERIE